MKTIDHIAKTITENPNEFTDLEGDQPLTPDEDTFSNQRLPNYTIIKETDQLILIKDIGPWDRHPTITNAAEIVVAQLVPRLQGRRLEYIDSEGRRDRLLVKNGQFAGFAPANPD